eukprot:SAG11_NODE_29912_length_306_cov_0.478261_1_plen_38_part_10
MQPIDVYAIILVSPHTLASGSGDGAQAVLRGEWQWWRK